MIDGSRAERAVPGLQVLTRNRWQGKQGSCVRREKTKRHTEQKAVWQANGPANHTQTETHACIGT